MAKRIRAAIELASEKDVLSVLKKDAPILSSKPDDFIRDNLLGYYIAINTWLLMIKQWSLYGWTFLWNAIQEEGLISIIGKMVDSSYELIQGTEISYSIARQIYCDVRNTGTLKGIPTTDEFEVFQEPTAAMLMICRYLKRLSPVKADKLTDSSLQDFVDRQTKLRAQQQQELSPYITSRVRDYLARLIDWDSLCDDLENVDITDIKFTPGVTFDTNADYVSKLSFMAKERVEYFPQPFGVPMVAHVPTDDPVETWGSKQQYDKHCVYITAVPKNYKAARVIAPENVYRQALARRYFEIMDCYTPTTIRLHDQGQNQKLAYEGSMCPDKWSTLDLRAASDSITWSLLVDLCPSERFLKLMQNVLPTHYKIGKKDTRIRMLHSTATMGNSCTFWLESIIFNGVDGAATECVDVFEPHIWNEELERSTYGDDIISRTYAAATTVDWLEILGFEVNTDKSYYSEELSYRESCGVEYLGGVNLTTLYFPRFPIVGDLKGYVSPKTFRDGWTGEYATSLTSMVSLQQRLFPVCTPAALLLAELIKECEPRMTTTQGSLEHQDLTSYETRGKIFSAPGGKFNYRYAEKDKKGNEKKFLIITKKDDKGREIGYYVRSPYREFQRLSYKEDDGCEPYCLREGHLNPCTTYDPLGESQMSDYEKLLVDLYNYQQFLKHGPRYESELDRLLNVSSPPMSYAQAAGKIQIVWRYVK